MKRLGLIVLLATAVTGAAQELKQYNGDYPSPVPYYWYALNPTATYSYYDAPSGEGRIFHGPFKVKFDGEGSTARKNIYGSISGNFKNDCQDGEWTMIYPINILGYRSSKQYTGTFKCTFVNGRLNGDATYVVKLNSTGKIVFSEKVHLVNGLLDGPYESFEAKDGQEPEETIRGAFKNGKRVGTWNIQYGPDQYLMIYNDYESCTNYEIDHRTGDKNEYGYVLPRRNATGNRSILNIVDFILMRKSAKMPPIESLEKEEVQDELINYEPGDERVYTVVEQMPQYPGGDAALLDDVAKNICYPSAAQENGIEGRVVVRFVVTKNGSVGDVKIVRGKDPDLDKEAKRVIKTVKKFSPGKMNGKAVNVWYTLPVTFKVQRK